MNTARQRDRRSAGTEIVKYVKIPLQSVNLLQRNREASLDQATRGVMAAAAIK